MPWSLSPAIFDLQHDWSYYSNFHVLLYIYWMWHSFSHQHWWQHSSASGQGFPHPDWSVCSPCTLAPTRQNNISHYVIVWQTLNSNNLRNIDLRVYISGGWPRYSYTRIRDLSEINVCTDTVQAWLSFWDINDIDAYTPSSQSWEIYPCWQAPDI